MILRPRLITLSLDQFSPNTQLLSSILSPITLTIRIARLICFSSDLLFSENTITVADTWIEEVYMQSISQRVRVGEQVNELYYENYIFFLLGHLRKCCFLFLADLSSLKQHLPNPAS